MQNVKNTIDLELEVEFCTLVTKPFRFFYEHLILVQKCFGSTAYIIKKQSV